MHANATLQDASRSNIPVILPVSCSSIEMNIINLSLGTGPNYRSNPIANLAEKLTADYNIVVVAAIGNNGGDVRSRRILVHTLR
jgi:hypothetical protein